MSMTIGQLAGAAGVHVETVRYYERRGLIAQPPKEDGAYRRYTENDRDRLLFIKRAQEFGFTLAEISELLDGDDVQARAMDKLAAVETEMDRLRAVQDRLSRLIDV